MIYTVDRFEENFAVLEDAEMNITTVDRNCIPNDAKEGSVLNFENGIYCLDNNLTSTRKEIISSKFNRLRKK